MTNQEGPLGPFWVACQWNVYILLFFHDPRLITTFLSIYLYCFLIFIYWFESERERDLLSHLFMHSLVDFCMFPNQGSNTRSWGVWLGWCSNQLSNPAKANLPLLFNGQNIKAKSPLAGALNAKRVYCIFLSLHFIGLHKYRCIHQQHSFP